MVGEIGISIAPPFTEVELRQQNEGAMAVTTIRDTEVKMREFDLTLGCRRNDKSDLFVPVYILSRVKTPRSSFVCSTLCIPNNSFFKSISRSGTLKKNDDYRLRLDDFCI